MWENIWKRESSYINEKVGQSKQSAQQLCHLWMKTVYFFLSNLSILFSPCHSALAHISSTMLNKCSEREYTCFMPNLRGSLPFSDH